MTYVIKVHGFEREGTDFNASANGYNLSEEVLVEAASPMTTLAQVVSELPAYGSPGTTDFNPYGLTFTLNQSSHPDAILYRLNSVSSGRRIQDTCFWVFPLTYSTASPFAGSGPGAAPNDSKRKDQKVKKPDSDTDADKEPIDNPLERPPVFSGSSKIVQVPVYYDRQDRIIHHTNGLPISQPVSLPKVFKNWSWSFNISANGFNMINFDAIENKVNLDDVSINQGGASTPDYTILAGYLKNTGFSFSEHWETPANSTVEYHYVRVTANFEVSPDLWNTPPLSLHTKQKIVAAGPCIPIKINERGDTATEPWPLDVDGVAIPFDELAITAKEDFGVLQVDYGIDQEDYEPYQEVAMDTFFSTYDLDLPRFRT
jgi:hypothetical protein